MSSVSKKIITNDNEKRRFDFKISFIAEFNKIYYIVKIGKDNELQKIIVLIEKDDFCSIRYYKNIISKESLLKHSKYFRQCDSIDEILEFISKIIEYKNESRKNYNIRLEKETENTMTLTFDVLLGNGKPEIINIILESVIKSNTKIIEDLVNYIKYIKSIPGVIEILNKNKIHETIIKEKESGYKDNIIKLTEKKRKRELDEESEFINNKEELNNESKNNEQIEEQINNSNKINEEDNNIQYWESSVDYSPSSKNIINIEKEKDFNIENENNTIINDYSTIHWCFSLLKSQ